MLIEPSRPPVKVTSLAGFLFQISSLIIMDHHHASAWLV